MREDCSVPTEASLADSDSADSDYRRTDGSVRSARASITQYALVGVGLLVVGLAVAFVMTGGVLDGASPSDDVNDTDPAPDTDPTPAEDDDDNETSDPVENPDDGGNDDNTTDGSDESDSGSEGGEDTDDDSSDDGSESDQNETESDEPEYASLVGSVEVQDLGVTDDGGVGVYDQETSSLVGFYDLSNSTNFIIEELPPNKAYTVKVTADQAPPKEITITPEPGETLTRQFEVGHNFRGTDAFIEEWHIEIQDGPTYTDGITKIDTEDNLYSAWDDPAVPEKYKNVFIDATNASYTTFGKGEWLRANGHYGPEGWGVAEKLPLQGLGGVEERVFQKETERWDGNGTVYQYHLPADREAFAGDDWAVYVNVDPETGYVTSFSYPETKGYKSAEFIVKKHGNGSIEALPERFRE
jgi:hypothetical protein